MPTPRHVKRQKAGKEQESARILIHGRRRHRIMRPLKCGAAETQQRSTDTGEQAHDGTPRRARPDGAGRARKSGRHEKHARRHGAAAAAAVRRLVRRGGAPPQQQQQRRGHPHDAVRRVQDEPEQGAAADPVPCAENQLRRRAADRQEQEKLAPAGLLSRLFPR